ncbi:hypothetical protein Runsl_5844 (plasmid) [Runella slithyformis DSM 19594]|uniref:Uncharacterized protein n=1 Tax=Runella slithyformis (strain ATCC 29530 / DSM 19594 / LMG 11500 / NCIMB 11436 / LSU 4) TaxID=761193 RepID=A0A7U3ZRQ1_RUNSL|nr:hypothetical protein Runsl_5844 [Runella slithyformis DSM 19594]
MSKLNSGGDSYCIFFDDINHVTRDNFDRISARFHVNVLHEMRAAIRAQK